MTINAYLDLVKDAIETLPEFAGIGVVVDHQQDLESMKAEHLAKGKGYVVMIGEVSNRISKRDLDGPVVKLKFGVTIYSPKIIAAGCRTGADLRDTVLRRLHLSKLQESQHCFAEAYYVDGRTFEETEQNQARLIHATSFETDIIYSPHPDLEH